METDLESLLFGRKINPYTMTAKDEVDIEQKVSSFIASTQTDKNIIVTIITAKDTEHQEENTAILAQTSLHYLKRLPQGL